MQKETIHIGSQLPEENARKSVTLPDGHTPTPLGSGLVTRIISTGGGMAVIYEIWNPDLEVRRAIKLLRPDHSREAEERFQTEMKISAKLHHPNIIEIYSIGSWNRLPFIEMEEIEGDTVEKLIYDSGRLPLEVCTSIGIMIGRALNYAHNQKYMLYGKEYHGVIHRDLKPSNIMVCKDGTVKLMDFGIATPTTASMHTMEGTVVGTLQYLAPEQLEGKEIDVRVDIYALGAVLYEMLTGVRAFPETSLARLVPDKLHNRFIPLQNYRLKIPRSLRDLVHRCMRYEKEKRIGSALEYLRILGNIHKRISAQSPEQIMRRFMQNEKVKNAPLQIRSYRTLWPLFIWTLTAGAFLSAGIIGAWFILRIRAAKYDIYEADVFAGNESPQHREENQQGAHQGEARAQEMRDLPHAGLTIERRRNMHDGRDGNLRPVPAGRAEEKGKTAAEKPGDILQQAGPSMTEGESGEAPLQAPTMYEALQNKYKTNNAFFIFISEVNAENYRTALDVFKHIPPAESLSKKAVIFKIRALNGAGRKNEIQAIVAGTDIADGEFYLEKALFHYAEQEYSLAQQLLAKASSLPCEFMDQQVFRGKLLHTKGLCASAVFDKSPSLETKRAAMGAWFDVKTFFKYSPEHAYFKTADEEIRRINKVVIEP